MVLLLLGGFPETARESKMGLWPNSAQLSSKGQPDHPWCHLKWHLRVMVECPSLSIHLPALLLLLSPLLRLYCRRNSAETVMGHSIFLPLHISFSILSSSSFYNPGSGRSSGWHITSFCEVLSGSWFLSTSSPFYQNRQGLLQGERGKESHVTNFYQVWRNYSCVLEKG